MFLIAGPIVRKARLVIHQLTSLTLIYDSHLEKHLLFIG